MRIINANTQTFRIVAIGNELKVAASGSELKVAYRASKRLQIRKTTKNFIIYIYKQNSSRLLPTAVNLKLQIELRKFIGRRQDEQSVH